MKGSIGFVVGLFIIWVLCEWRVYDRRQISSAEFIDRLRRQKLGLKIPPRETEPLRTGLE